MARSKSRTYAPFDHMAVWSTVSRSCLSAGIPCFMCCGLRFLGHALVLEFLVSCVVEYRCLLISSVFTVLDLLNTGFCGQTRQYADFFKTSLSLLNEQT